MHQLMQDDKEVRLLHQGMRSDLLSEAGVAQRLAAVWHQTLCCCPLQSYKHMREASLSAFSYTAAGLRAKQDRHAADSPPKTW